MLKMSKRELQAQCRKEQRDPSRGNPPVSPQDSYMTQAAIERWTQGRLTSSLLPDVPESHIIMTRTHQWKRHRLSPRRRCVVKAQACPRCLRRDGQGVLRRFFKFQRRHGTIEEQYTTFNSLPIRRMSHTQTRHGASNHRNTE